MTGASLCSFTFWFVDKFCCLNLDLLDFLDFLIFWGQLKQLGIELRGRQLKQPGIDFTFPFVNCIGFSYILCMEGNCSLKIIFQIYLFY